MVVDAGSERRREHNVLQRQVLGVVQDAEVRHVEFACERVLQRRRVADCALNDLGNRRLIR
jgi:hypothetical protein